MTFIEVTEVEKSGDVHKTLVNYYNITSMSSYDISEECPNGCKIFFTNGNFLCVVESISEIKKMLGEQEKKEVEKENNRFELMDLEE